MRLITISLCALALAAAPAAAKKGHPVTGAGVWIETRPDGIMHPYPDVNSAANACLKAKGAFISLRGTFICSNPRFAMVEAAAGKAKSRRRQSRPR